MKVIRRSCVALILASTSRCSFFISASDGNDNSYYSELDYNGKGAYGDYNAFSVDPAEYGYRDSRYLPYTNLNLLKYKMYYADSFDVLGQLSNFKKLYISYHNCAWSYQNSDRGSSQNERLLVGSRRCGDGDNSTEDNWYHGGSEYFGANAAFSLYGVHKKSFSSGCQESTFINSFVTTNGLGTFELFVDTSSAANECTLKSYSYSQKESASSGSYQHRRAWSYETDSPTVAPTFTATASLTSLPTPLSTLPPTTAPTVAYYDTEQAYYSGNVSFSGDDLYWRNYSTTTGCSADGYFTIDRFDGKGCDGSKYLSTLRSLTALNRDLLDIQCGLIYDASDGTDFATELLTNSVACTKAEHGTFCPDPFGIVQNYEQNMIEAASKHRKGIRVVVRDRLVVIGSEVGTGVFFLFATAFLISAKIIKRAGGKNGKNVYKEGFVKEKSLNSSSHKPSEPAAPYMFPMPIDGTPSESVLDPPTIIPHSACPEPDMNTFSKPSPNSPFLIIKEGMRKKIVEHIKRFNRAMEGSAAVVRSAGQSAKKAVATWSYLVVETTKAIIEELFVERSEKVKRLTSEASVATDDESGYTSVTLSSKSNRETSSVDSKNSEQLSLSPIRKENNLLHSYPSAIDEESEESSISFIRPGPRNASVFTQNDNNGSAGKGTPAYVSNRVVETEDPFVGELRVPFAPDESVCIEDRSVFTGVTPSVEDEDTLKSLSSRSLRGDGPITDICMDVSWRSKPEPSQSDRFPKKSCLSRSPSSVDEEDSLKAAAREARINNRQAANFVTFRDEDHLQSSFRSPNSSIHDFVSTQEEDSARSLTVCLPVGEARRSVSVDSDLSFPALITISSKTRSPSRVPLDK